MPKLTKRFIDGLGVVPTGTERTYWDGGVVALLEMCNLRALLARFWRWALDERLHN